MGVDMPKPHQSRQKLEQKCLITTIQPNLDDEAQRWSTKEANSVKKGKPVAWQEQKPKENLIMSPRGRSSWRDAACGGQPTSIGVTRERGW